jgi:hypothetical protein
MSKFVKREFEIGGVSLDSIPLEQVEEISSIASAVTAVMVVTDEELSRRACSAIAQLYRRGCRLFAFVGPRSEQSHDCFDEVLQELVDDVPMTTYHVDEPSDDTAAMVVMYLRDKSSSQILLVDGSRDASAEVVRSLRRTVSEP